MSEVRTYRANKHPSEITLILAASNQTPLIIELLNQIPSDYSGAILLAQTGSIEERTHCETRIRESTDKRPKLVSGNLSLSTGRVYLIESDLNYTLNSADQLQRSNAAASNGMLLESLRQRYLSKARIVLLSTLYSNQLIKLPATNKPRPRLISLGVLAEMASTLFRRLATIYDLKLCKSNEHLFTQIRAPLGPRGSMFQNVGSSERSGFNSIIALLKAHKSANFEQYKESALFSQIVRRMRRLRLSNLEQYADRLKVDTRELESLHSNLLIGVTQFFRDGPVFVELQKYLSDYIEKTDRRSLRIWSAGCSTGAEPYTLALICDLIRRDRAPNLDVQIYGTDIEAAALNLASAGLYRREEIEHIPAEYLPKKIGRVDALYNLKDYIETPITFEQQDLLKEPNYSELDLIVCRNVFIYFSPETQFRVLEGFHRALRPGGLMMLGRGENTGGQRSHFTPVSERAKIYRALQLSPSS